MSAKNKQSQTVETSIPLWSKRQPKLALPLPQILKISSQSQVIRPHFHCLSSSNPCRMANAWGSWLVTIPGDEALAANASSRKRILLLTLNCPPWDPYTPHYDYDYDCHITSRIIIWIIYIYNQIESYQIIVIVISKKCQGQCQYHIDITCITVLVLSYYRARVNMFTRATQGTRSICVGKVHRKTCCTSWCRTSPRTSCPRSVRTSMQHDHPGSSEAKEPCWQLMSPKQTQAHSYHKAAMSRIVSVQLVAMSSVLMRLFIRPTPPLHINNQS